MKLPRLLLNIRFYVLCFSVILSAIIYSYNSFYYSGTDLFLIKLAEGYGLIALIYLYITLLASPFTQAFSYFPFKSKYIEARRAIGVSVLYFAILHSLAGFLGPLGGFNGIGFLHDNFLWAVILGGMALIILTYMAFTSFDKVVEKMGFPAWKMLHRTIYLGGTLILIHALLIGSQFMDLSSTIPQVIFYALFFLLVLEAIRFDKYLYTQYLHEQSQRVTSRKLTSTTPTLLPNVAAVKTHSSASMTAFTFNFISPKKVEVNQLIRLEFQLSDSSQKLLSNASQKIAFQVVIIDQSLETFVYLDPVISKQSLLATGQFPHEGLFHIYLTALIPGKGYQVAHFTLDVGHHLVPTNPTQTVDQTVIKNLDGMQVSLAKVSDSGVVIASQNSSLVAEIHLPLSQASQVLLKPIFGKYGWGMMVNQQTFDYIPLITEQNGLVISQKKIRLSFKIPAEFMPLKSGVYRIFIQFRIARLHTVDFTIKI